MRQPNRLPQFGALWVAFGFAVFKPEVYTQAYWKSWQTEYRAWREEMEPRATLDENGKYFAYDEWMPQWQRMGPPMCVYKDFNYKRPEDCCEMTKKQGHVLLGYTREGWVDICLKESETGRENEKAEEDDAKKKKQKKRTKTKEKHDAGKTTSRGSDAAQENRSKA